MPEKRYGRNLGDTQSATSACIRGSFRAYCPVRTASTFYVTNSRTGLHVDVGGESIFLTAHQIGNSARAVVMALDVVDLASVLMKPMQLHAKEQP